MTRHVYLIWLTPGDPGESKQRYAAVDPSARLIDDVCLSQAVLLMVEIDESAKDAIEDLAMADERALAYMSVPIDQARAVLGRVVNYAACDEFAHLSGYHIDGAAAINAFWATAWLSEERRRARVSLHTRPATDQELLHALYLFGEEQVESPAFGFTTDRWHKVYMKKGTPS